MARTHQNDQNHRAFRTPTGLLTLGGAAALLLAAGHAAADDGVGSLFDIRVDSQSSFKAHGWADFKDDDRTPGTIAFFTRFHIPGAVHWGFVLGMEIVDWEWTTPDGLDRRGADRARLFLEGYHSDPPHGEGWNDLPQVANARGVNIPFLTFFSYPTRKISVSGVDDHGDHLDWYRATMDAHAVRNPEPDVFALVGGPFTVETGHLDANVSNEGLDRDHATLGATPRTGTMASYDPSTSTLTLRLGAIDVLDQDGGRTGAVAPEFADDPLVGARPDAIVLDYGGIDPGTGAHVFRGGTFFVAGVDHAEVAIGGQLGTLTMRSTLAGESLGNAAAFTSLSVADTLHPDERDSPWADRFVQGGWFGEELSPEQLAQRVTPVLTILTDLDLVDATGGFERRAEVPATVLVTMATDPDASVPCYADLDGDGVLTLFDFLAFQNAFDTGSTQADCDGDGDLTLFDFLCFQNAFDAGC
jgi:hypothetical protein